MQIIRLPENVMICINLLNQAGFEAYTVGGAVRDALLGLPVHDYDLTTNASPEEMHAVFKNYRTLDTGIKHGTITVLMKHEPLEITTYRTESEYSDHRHPDKVAFTRSLKEDCARRDFTINAMAYHPEEGLQDFFGGEEDLKNHTLRTVGDPYERFREDALRILRAVRFMAQLNFTIEEKTSWAIHARHQDLKFISMERIQNELLRTLKAEGCAKVFHDYIDLFRDMIPELKSCSGEEIQHIGQSLSRSQNDSTLRMALVLSPLSEQTAFAICQRLKCSNDFRTSVQTCLRSRFLPLNTKADVRRLMRLELSPDKLLHYRWCLDTEVNIELLQNYSDEIIRDNDCINLKDLAVNGSDLKALGISGKEIRTSLEAALEAVIQEEISNTKEAIFSYLTHK